MSTEKKVLIIDDEADFCLLLREYLIRKNYTVYFSNTLAEGREILKSIIPEIIFLDNNLPDGLGWASAPEIALMLPETLFILISAFHPDIPAMPANTRIKVIEKPMSMVELERQIGTI